MVSTKIVYGCLKAINTVQDNTVISIKVMAVTSDKHSEHDTE